MEKYLGQDIKKLGFGLMRLPKIDEKIDIEQTKKMVDTFLESGFTYFDTAWAYEGSEDAIRQALVERYPRDKFQLATKNAAWINCKTKEDAMKQFDTSLKQTGAGYFDFYLLHNLGDGRTQVFEDFDMWNWALEKKKEGLIKHLGFSFHSTPEQLEEIFKSHPEAEFVQLQINYADWESNNIQSRACYEVARKYNIPVIIMEPVKGGMLAKPPQVVKDVFNAANKDASYASWAVRFAANLDGVITVLSGMSNIEQMEDNLSYMRDFKGLSNSEKQILDDAREALNNIPLVPCTTCNYCAKVCPSKIGIAGTFIAINSYKTYGDMEEAHRQEGWTVTGAGMKQAKDCIKCGKCEEVCPQHIAIREELEKAAECLGQNK